MYPEPVSSTRLSCSNSPDSFQRFGSATTGVLCSYSLVPIYSDRKLYEHVCANKENKTLVMAYLIISLLTIAQLATIIIFLNNLVQIFV